MSHLHSVGAALTMLSFGIGGVFPAAAQTSNPVVVELFTSEGCSSCPPGEKVLSILESEAKTGNSSIIALEWHVDYWDYLGWKDRFGSEEATQRQYTYARTLPSSVYTPQAVINGTKVPSYAGDLKEMNDLVHRAAEQPSSTRIDVAVAATPQPGLVELKVTSSGVPSKARIQAVLVEAGLSSKPKAGENAGQSLYHTQVVRRSQMLEGSQHSFTFAVPPSIDRSKAAIVLLVQDPESMAILASCRAAVPSATAVSMRSQWKGWVVDRWGAVLSNVPLQACSDQVCVLGTTDSRGNFVFESLPPGKYSLTVGIQSHVSEVTLTEGLSFDQVKPVVVP